MRKSRISILTIFALIFSVLIPGQMSSSAVPSITKTVTVKKSDNTPYANVLVSFVYWDFAAQMQRIVSPVTTNESGVAAVTFSSGLRIQGLAAQPVAGDNTHSLYLDDQSFFTNDSDQSFTISMKPVSILGKILRPDGTDSPGGYGIEFPASNGQDAMPQYRITLRPGIFGMDLSSTLAPGTDYSILAFGPGNPNEFDSNFGLRVIDVSGVKTPLIFTSSKFTSQLTPVADVFSFKLRSGNLSGQLQNSDGSALALPDGVIGRLMFYPAQGDGSINFNGCCSQSFKLAADGSFSADFSSNSPGKYFPVASIAGSATIPTFVGAPIWLNASGSYSTDGTSFLTPANFVLGLKVPVTAPNLVLKYVRSDGTVEVGSQFLTPASNGSGFFFAGYAANGIASFVLPNGTYRTNMNPTDSTYKTTKYQVSVSGGTATVTTLGGSVVTPTAGVYSLESLQSNLRIIPTNPLDASKPLWRGVWASVNNSSGQQIAYGNINNGNISLALPNGADYVMQLSPQPDLPVKGLGSRSFKIDVVAGVVTLKDFQTNSTISTGADGFYALDLARANVKGRVLGADGKPILWNPQTGNSVHIEVQKQVSGNWEWVRNYTDSDADGEFFLSVTEPGTYRLRLEPWGIPDVATTNTSTFVVTSTPADFNLGDVTLNSPSLKVIVRAPGGTENLDGVYINIKQGNSWLEGASVNNGVASLAVAEAGEYELIVNPPYGGGLLNVAKKSYKLTMTQNADGSFTAAIEGKTKDAASGAFILELGVPTLIGTVTAPDGVTRLQRARIVAIDTATGQSMWDYSIDSDASGNWAMALPAGKYKVRAQSPWNDSRYGDGPETAEFTVDANGVANLPNASSLALSVAWPTWSGVIKAPTGETVMTNARICMMPNSQNTNWICANTNKEGKWALSKPTGFTGFDSSTEIEIGENYDSIYAPKRVRGEAEAIALLGAYTAGQTYSDITLRLAQPNTEITVTADGEPVSNVWVSADRDMDGWLGGGMTNSQGVARLNISNPSTAFRVRAHLENNPTVSENYAATQVSFSSGQISSGTVDGVFKGEIQLAQPNLRGTLSEPNGGAKIPYAWIEIHNVSKNSWEGGANTNSAGKFALNLVAPTSGSTEYRITANNRWQATSTSAKTIYKAIVTSAGNITLTKIANGATISPSSGLYALELSEPAISGGVQMPNGSPVRDSWVVPTKDGRQFWEYGANSSPTGGFGLAVPEDGTYTVDAEVPWNATTPLARSAKCTVVVSGGTITNAPDVDCIDDASKNVTLKLREPNVTFKFVKPDVTPITGVAWANISVSVGNWYTWGHSYADGSVGIFIDKDAIAAANPGATGTTDIHVWVNAPYNDSSVVGWNCNSGDLLKPICKDLPDFTYGSDYPIKSLGNVTFLKPNTKLQVLDPNGQPVGAGAWVTIFKRVDSGDHINYWNQWIGLGDDTDSDGYATFNIEDTSGFFGVEVNAPWNQKDIYAQENYVGTTGSGLEFADVNAKTFRLAAPNLTMNIKEAFSPFDPVNWAWIGVQEVDPNNGDNFVKWVSGYGSGSQGSVSMKLASGKRFKLEIYPGYASAGVRTTCIVDVSSTGDVSRAAGKCTAGDPVSAGIMNLTLDAGNVQGYVYRLTSENGLPGAVVYAEAFDKTSHNALNISETANTDSSGRYGLQLNPAYDWKIKVFYVNLPGDTVQLQSITTGEAVSVVDGAVTNKNFTLVS